MKTDNRSQNIIMMVIIVILTALVIYIAKRRPSPVAAQTVVTETVMTAADKQWYEETLRAYNHLLHQVWLDRPSYVEDVLSEYDEFITLDSLLNGHWEDTFEFYNTQDSIEYHQNWFREHSLDPGCEEIPELPSRTTSLLLKVFGNGD